MEQLASYGAEEGRLLATPCSDYCQLNLQAVEDKYPLSNIADLAASLDGYKLFSKLDLREGYLQVPVAAEDLTVTAIIMPFG
jgi:hypothetical protein